MIVWVIFGIQVLILIISGLKKGFLKNLVSFILNILNVISIPSLWIILIIILLAYFAYRYYRKKKYEKDKKALEDKAMYNNKKWIQ